MRTAPPTFAPAEVQVTWRADGTLVLRSPHALAPHETSLGRVLRDRAAQHGERTFLAERDDDGAWRTRSWAAVYETVRALGESLLDRDAGPSRPVMVLSDNGIDHALLALAAMSVGVPVAPISVAYSLQSKDHARLRAVFAALTPAVVFADDGALYAQAIAALPREGCEVVLARNVDAVPGATDFARLCAARPTARVDAVIDALDGSSVAKVLFTSGSTGAPKGVVNTHAMLCANQQGLLQGWPFLAERPPVTVDWLPWSHTFGGNHNFNQILWNGGTLYIDRGKPVPARIGETVRALSEVSPTVYFNVPRGFAALVPLLERDEALRARLFGDLDLLFYAAAALPQHLWNTLSALARTVRPEGVPFVSAWGSTETSPLVTQVHFPLDRPGVIGLPIAGAALKMVPDGARYELRVGGAGVTPGYWRDEAATQAAFDDEGFYRIGDAGRLCDPADPRRGVVFDGRVAEDFKLSSGTWVRVGALRVALVSALAPWVQDAVLTGHDRDEPGALLFVDRAQFEERVWRAGITAALRAFASGEGSAASARVTRVIVLDEPPSIDAGEITDKGYLNQRRVLERRAAWVERLYAGDGDAIVV